MFASPHPLKITRGKGEGWGEWTEKKINLKKINF